MHFADLVTERFQNLDGGGGGGDRFVPEKNFGMGWGGGSYLPGAPVIPIKKRKFGR